MVGGCGGCEMGGWIWWLAALGCERETQRRESQKKRGKIKKKKKMIKKEYLNEVLKKNRIFYGRDVVKWCTICYKIGF